MRVGKLLSTNLGLKILVLCIWGEKDIPSITRNGTRYRIHVRQLAIRLSCTHSDIYGAIEALEQYGFIYNLWKEACASGYQFNINFPKYLALSVDDLKLSSGCFK